MAPIIWMLALIAWIYLKSSDPVAFVSGTLLVVIPFSWGMKMWSRAQAARQGSEPFRVVMLTILFVVTSLTALVVGGEFLDYQLSPIPAAIIAACVSVILALCFRYYYWQEDNRKQDEEQ